MKSYHNYAENDIKNTNKEKKNDDNAGNIIINKERANDDIEDFMRNLKHALSNPPWIDEIEETSRFLAEHKTARSRR